MLLQHADGGHAFSARLARTRIEFRSPARDSDKRATSDDTLDRDYSKTAYLLFFYRRSRLATLTELQRISPVEILTEAMAENTAPPRSPCGRNTRIYPDPSRWDAPFSARTAGGSPGTVIALRPVAGSPPIRRDDNHAAPSVRGPFPRKEA